MYRETMLRNYLIEKIVHEIPDVRVNGHRTKRLPGNVSVSFKGVDGASLLILLDEDGKGLFENVLYDGMKELLAEVASLGKKICDRDIKTGSIYCTDP